MTQDLPPWNTPWQMIEFPSTSTTIIFGPRKVPSFWCQATLVFPLSLHHYYTAASKDAQDMRITACFANSLTWLHTPG
jgi:hypothetical protein